MTNRQKKFCKEYIKDYDEAAAVIRAGYRKARAIRTAKEMLGIAEVREYIADLEKQAAEKSIACTPEILEYFTKLMRDEVFEQRIEVNQETGEEMIVRQPVKVSDRTKAAEFLAKYHKMLGDREEEKGNQVVRVELDKDIKKWAQ